MQHWSAFEKSETKALSEMEKAHMAKKIAFDVLNNPKVFILLFIILIYIIIY